MRSADANAGDVLAGVCQRGEAGIVRGCRRHSDQARRVGQHGQRQYGGRAANAHVQGYQHDDTAAPAGNGDAFADRRRHVLLHTVRQLVRPPAQPQPAHPVRVWRRAEVRMSRVSQKVEAQAQPGAAHAHPSASMIQQQGAAYDAALLTAAVLPFRCGSSSTSPKRRRLLLCRFTFAGHFRAGHTFFFFAASYVC